MVRTLDSGVSSPGIGFPHSANVSVQTGYLIRGGFTLSVSIAVNYVVHVP